MLCPRLISATNSRFDFLVLTSLAPFSRTRGRLAYNLWTSLKEVASQFFVSGHVLPRRSLYSLVPHDPDPRL